MDLGQLDVEAIARLKSEIWPDLTTVDELHDALMNLGFFIDAEVKQYLILIFFCGIQIFFVLIKLRV